MSNIKAKIVTIIANFLHSKDELAYTLIEKSPRSLAKWKDMDGNNLLFYAKLCNCNASAKLLEKVSDTVKRSKVTTLTTELYQLQYTINCNKTNANSLLIAAIKKYEPVTILSQALKLKFFDIAWLLFEKQKVNLIDIQNFNDLLTLLQFSNLQFLHKLIKNYYESFGFILSKTYSKNTLNSYYQYFPNKSCNLFTVALLECPIENLEYIHKTYLLPQSGLTSTVKTALLKLAIDLNKIEAVIFLFQQKIICGDELLNNKTILEYILEKGHLNLLEVLNKYNPPLLKTNLHEPITIYLTHAKIGHDWYQELLSHIPEINLNTDEQFTLLIRNIHVASHSFSNKSIYIIQQLSILTLNSPLASTNNKIIETFGLMLLIYVDISLIIAHLICGQSDSNQDKFQKITAKINNFVELCQNQSLINSKDILENVYNLKNIFLKLARFYSNTPDKFKVSLEYFIDYLSCFSSLNHTNNRLFKNSILFKINACFLLQEFIEKKSTEKSEKLAIKHITAKTSEFLTKLTIELTKIEPSGLIAAENISIILDKLIHNSEEVNLLNNHTVQKILLNSDSKNSDSYINIIKNSITCINELIQFTQATPALIPKEFDPNFIDALSELAQLIKEQFKIIVLCIKNLDTIYKANINDKNKRKFLSFEIIPLINTLNCLCQLQLTLLEENYFNQPYQKELADIKNYLSKLDEKLLENTLYLNSSSQTKKLISNKKPLTSTTEQSSRANTKIKANPTNVINLVNHTITDSVITKPISNQHPDLGLSIEASNEVDTFNKVELLKALSTLQDIHELSTKLTVFVATLKEPLTLEGNIKKVVELIKQNIPDYTNFLLLATGGLWRDKFLYNRSPNDWDLVTNIPLDQLMNIFANAGILFSLNQTISGNISRKRIALKFPNDVKIDIVALSSEHSYPPYDIEYRDLTVNMVMCDLLKAPPHQLIAPSQCWRDLMHRKLATLYTPVQEKEKLKENPENILRIIYLLAKDIKINHKSKLKLSSSLNQTLRDMDGLITLADEKELPPGPKFYQVTKLFTHGYAARSYQLLKKYNLLHYLSLYDYFDSPLAKEFCTFLNKIDNAYYETAKKINAINDNTIELKHNNNNWHLAILFSGFLLPLFCQKFDQTATFLSTFINNASSQFGMVPNIVKENMNIIFSAILADISNVQAYKSNEVIKADVSYQKLYHPLLALAKRLSKQPCNVTLSENDTSSYYLVKPNTEVLTGKESTTNSQAKLLAHTGILSINNKSNCTNSNHIESQPKILRRPK